MSEEVTILSYEETDDGGAIIHLSLSPKAQQAILQEGFVTILKRSIEEGYWDEESS